MQALVWKPELIEQLCLALHPLYCDVVHGLLNEALAKRNIISKHTAGEHDLRQVSSERVKVEWNFSLL